MKKMVILIMWKIITMITIIHIIVVIIGIIIQVTSGFTIRGIGIGIGIGIILQ